MLPPDILPDHRSSCKLAAAREIIKMSGLSPKTLGLCGDGAFNAYNMALITKTIKLTNYDSEQLQAYMMILEQLSKLTRGMASRPNWGSLARL